MRKLIFHINDYYLIDKFQDFVKLLQIIHANVKLSKTLLSKIMKSAGFLGEPRRPLLKTGLPLINMYFQLKAPLYY